MQLPHKGGCITVSAHNLMQRCSDDDSTAHAYLRLRMQNSLDPQQPHRHSVPLQMQVLLGNSLRLQVRTSRSAIASMMLH